MRRITGAGVRSANATRSLISEADDLWGMAQRVHKFWRDKSRWTITLSSDDRLYDIAMRWFLSEEADAKPPRNLRARYSRTAKEPGPTYYGELPDIPTSEVDLIYNETSQRSVTVKGHRVVIALKKPGNGPEGDEVSLSSRLQPDQLNFYARSYEGQMAVVEHLKELMADQDKRKPALHLLSGWGDWTRRDDLPPRSLESVVLKSGQMERIRDDIETFLASESDYNRRGMPFHRGYMLYGPPGTGKTSVVRAFAAHFGLDLWYAPLGDLDKDTALMQLVNQVKPGSILLLEDIDVYHATRDRDDTVRGSSMAGLLNALDGVATPHGLITFMTTNEIDVIDPALLRPGRVDLIEEVGPPDRDQVARLYESWYSSTLTDYQKKKIKWSGTTAELTELFKQNLNDPESARLALQKLPL